MFSPAIGRAVRSPSTIPAPSVCTFARPATLAAAQKPFARPSHQRRLSSSKASIPPAGSNANGSSSTQQTPASAGKAPARKMTGKAGKKRTSTPPTPMLNVPHVPPTDYLQKPEVKISSFFSLHRPISLDKAIPPVATHTSFESIFAPRSPYNRKSTVENIQTLSSGIESLEAALAVQEKHAHEDASSQTEVQHLDGPPQVTLEELMARFVPFRPPPPPVPLGQAAETQPANNIVEDIRAPIKKRAWSTAVVVTESTDASGNRTYSATTAPMIEIDTPATEMGQEREQYGVRQPFLDRMRQRQYTNNRNRDNQQNPDMLAISVKRQRKLKMKKHKYKKLMKRTRLLRRKLDRT